MSRPWNGKKWLTPVKRRMAYLLRNAHFPITSWYDFDELRNEHPEFHDLSYDQIMRVIKFGLAEWYLRAEWRGVGMTPWAGSARRQRDYSRKDETLIKMFLENVGRYEASEKQAEEVRITEHGKLVPTGAKIEIDPAIARRVAL